ncbi:FAD-dependent oxidoreductase [Bradyrhizobium diazoefficiens]|uniref:FAD-dependent oxidoreductase n=1 Tax=Bradyrhizobium diazoefficiens TaxID=1355477 RepID=UPI003515EE67
MNNRFDVAIIGSGPAGMAAAVALREFDLSVIVIDEQPEPGGQIWRAIESNHAQGMSAYLGKEYLAGEAMAVRLRQSGAELRLATKVWQIEEGWQVFTSKDGLAERIQASAILLATGAQERPNPFPGWTLPGVMSVGAAQITLKSAGCIPDAPVHVAGSGPLPLLYMIQLLALGGRVAIYLDTTPTSNRRRAVKHFPKALLGWPELLKGARWLKRLRDAGVTTVRDVCDIEAIGDNALERVRYRCGNGREAIVSTNLLLVHEGVVPSIHSGMALGCQHIWREDQMCFVPVTDEWGETTRSGIFIAGDGAGIEGADAAVLRGAIAALGIAIKLGAIEQDRALQRKGEIGRRLRPVLAIRPFLDAYYHPRPQLFSPTDATIICRCEEITAGRVRLAARAGFADPNKIKAATRVGMGPCQGRQCAYTVSSLLANEQKKKMEEIGLFRMRPPFKPVTVGEISGIANDD